ncbi:hypothetical protein D9619_007747 [Psilocybe cf. subviscida]|uniref:Uncharacterized protein n=1 Tax=Psilocybe cf. subviscida TaxID=2480587 RepID=A0A8H5ESB9_9AGAR|nr:hypothetical protein D9619_007747 [Psilocybe cf. subviscida]
MSSKRHSLPSSFEYCGVVDCLATYNDLKVLKGLKQLPFDQGDFSSALPHIVQSLERFAPPPLALPKNWLGEATKDNVAAVPKPEPVSVNSLNTGDAIRPSEAPAEGPASAAGASLPKIPAKSPQRATDVTLPLSSASSTSSDADFPPPKTSTPNDTTISVPGATNARRQLSSTFVRGQRLPFSIVEEDEHETSESCYSTDEGAASSDSQHAEPDAISQPKSYAESASTGPNSANQPCIASSMKRPGRAYLIKDRMKRMLGARTLRTRVRG